MTKKYKLLKNLPELNAGIIFEDNDGIFTCVTDNGLFQYSEDTIKGNPEWFELVCDEKEDKPVNFVLKQLNKEDMIKSSNIKPTNVSCETCGTHLFKYGKMRDIEENQGAELFSIQRVRCPYCGNKQEFELLINIIGEDGIIF